jgi:calmodulin
MRSIGGQPTEEEVKEMIKEVDDDSDGEVDFDEFMQLMAKRMKEGEMDEELYEAFKTFDKDGKGFFTKEELQKVMVDYGEKLSSEDINLMF